MKEGMKVLNELTTTLSPADKTSNMYKVRWVGAQWAGFRPFSNPNSFFFRIVISITL